MEGKNMKKKGFTLVELLVVIAIIAMLLAILMPALAKVRTLAQRIMCGTNVGGIGKAMMTYASDDKYESYPIAGPAGTILDMDLSNNAECSWNWNCKDTPGTGQNNQTPYVATVSSCLYLLVKFSDVPPEQFICPGGEEKKFELTNYKTNEFATEKNPTSFTDCWDFGAYSDKNPNYSRNWGHNSYSYQQPLPLSTSQTPYNKPHPISATSAPVAVVLADRSPWWMSDDDYSQMGTYIANDTESVWDAARLDLSKDFGYRLNSLQHKKDGQSVLYADQHVKFEKLTNVGVDKDNIYTTWGDNSVTVNSQSVEQKAKTKQVEGTGKNPYRSLVPGNFSQDDTDTYLVQDYMAMP